MAALDFKAILAEERRRARAGLAGLTEQHERDSSGSSVLTANSVRELVDKRHALHQEQDVEWMLPHRPERPIFDAAAHSVQCSVAGIAHVPDWCSTEEEAEMLRCADGAPASRDRKSVV